MANTIRLKRASGSDPGASDLVTGELAVRTDTGKLFTKKDDNSVTEIGATVSSDAVDTAAIQDDAVTFAKLENIENNRILGRVSSGAGNAEELTQSQVRTLLNVENGATADQTASEILTLIKTVDGSGSGLDADTLDGISSASFVRSDASDTMAGVYTFSQAANEKIILSGSDDPLIRFQEGTTDKAFIQWNSAGFLRLMNQEDDSVLRIKDDIEFSQNNSTYHKVWHAGNDGSGSGLDADLLDGQEGSYYRNAGNLNAGTISDARLPSSISSDITGNSATATKLATARTIAGVSFDGSANISLNNNAITNGAGYITSSDGAITNKMPLAGGTFSGNLITRFIVPDGDGTRDLGTTSARWRAAYVDNYYGSGANLTNLPSQTDENFTTTLKNKLDGIAASATNVTNNNQLTNGAGYITATLTNEQVQDIVGAMVSGNTESGISVTYQDSDGTLDFSVSSQTDNNFTTTLKNKLDGIASGATNVTNNNQLTNGAGYITSADGGNAATLDSIDSSQFLRSDTTDTASSVLTLTSGLSFGADAKCAAGVSSLSDGSTITVNFTSGIHHSVTLGGNRTFGNPSNDANAVGQSGSIFITQDGTGSRTASFHSDYKFAGGTAPTLSTAANAVDRLDYVIKASGVIHCVVSLDVK